MTGIAEAKRRVGKTSWAATIIVAALPGWTTILIGTYIVGFAKAALLSDARLAAQMVVIFPVFAFCSFAVGLATCIVLVSPALGLVHWLKLTKSWQVAILGASGGMLAMLPFIVLSNATPSEEVAISTLLFMLAGVFAGMAAWRERQRDSWSI